MTEQQKQALQRLRSGGVIAYPTDTTYGIGCNALDDKAVAKVFKLKGRSFAKPLSLAFSDLKMLEQYTNLDDVPVEFLSQVFPGPVTLLLNKNEKISDVITAGSLKVGARIPGHPEILEIIKALGSPVVTTSANLSGEQDPTEASSIFLPVDYIYQGECQFKHPSTIIDVQNKTIVRTGVGANRYQQLIDRYLQSQPSSHITT